MKTYPKQILFTIFLLSLFFQYGCTSNTGKREQDRLTKTLSNDKKGGLRNSVAPQINLIKIVANDKIEDYLPGEAIVKDDILKLKNNHHKIMRKRKKQSTDETIDVNDTNDTKSIWFSKESIEKLMAQNNKVDGIRIYLGVYDDDKPITNNPKEHDKKETVILVTTKFNGTTSKGDTIHRDLLANGDFVNIGGYYTNRGMNHGELCTPNCNGTLIK